MLRTYRDRCPGVLRPWIADDGAIVRVRLPGGQISTDALTGLMELGDRFGDGHVLQTRRANLQLRGLWHEDGCVDPELVDGIVALGLLPSPSHELVRNLMMSPLTGRVGGRVDLRPLVADLDASLCADPELADLSGRFLFVLDDGRGDVADRTLDLGLMAVDDTHAQIRIGSHHWGEVVPLDEAVPYLLDLAHRFRRHRGEGERALWHVDELPKRGEELVGASFARDLRTNVSSLRPPVGPWQQGDGRYVTRWAGTAGGSIDADEVDDLRDLAGDQVLITPWHQVLVPDLDEPYPGTSDCDQFEPRLREPRRSALSDPPPPPCPLRPDPTEPDSSRDA